MKTIVLSPYTSNDTSMKIANRTAYHLKRHGLVSVVDRNTGAQARRNIEGYSPDLVLSFNVGYVSGGGIGLYCNANGRDFSGLIRNQLEEIQPTHETRQPALQVLQLAPCPAIMLNDYRKDIDTDEMARQITKGILANYGMTWKRTARKKAAAPETKKKGD